MYQRVIKYMQLRLLLRISIRVLKNRFAGVTGKACQLLFSLDTGRMIETFEEEAL